LLVWFGIGAGLEGGEGCWLGVAGWGFGGEAVFLLEEGEGAVDGFGGGGPGGGLGGLGGGCDGFRRGDFGDGGAGAEGFIEDDVFDEVVGSVGAGGGVGFTAGGGAGVAADVAAAGGGVSGVAAGGGGARLAREVGAGDEKAVEELAGALGVKLVGGDAVENLGESELDARAVVDGGQLELGLVGVDSAVARGGAAGGVVVIAEGLAAQGG
jgi:hypothetical protein